MEEDPLHTDEDIEGDDDDVENIGEDEEGQPWQGHEEAEEGQPTGPDEAEEAPPERAKKVAPKRVVKNPQPKLDAVRLCGERGINILPKMFESVKFKGKGHEHEDLTTLMKAYEHWGHRLFPRMTFDNIIERVEKLGTKRLAQVYVKKVRMGLEEVEGDDVRRFGDDIINDDDDDDKEENTISRPTDLSAQDDLFESLLAKTVGHTDVYSSSPPTEEPQPAPHPVVLSDEVRKRMERNRLLALEKKKKRSSVPQISDEPVVGTSAAVGKENDFQENPEREINGADHFEVTNNDVSVLEEAVIVNSDAVKQTLQTESSVPVISVAIETNSGSEEKNICHRETSDQDIACSNHPQVVNEDSDVDRDELLADEEDKATESFSKECIVEKQVTNSATEQGNVKDFTENLDVTCKSDEEH